MTGPGFPSRPSLFSRTLRECRQLYVQAGELIASKHSTLVTSPRSYPQLMDDLHRGLVLKLYLTICEADQSWSSQERLLAEVLCHHLWGTWIEGDQLRDTMKRASTETATLEWAALVRPFRTLAPLADKAPVLETLVTRLANLVARCDGDLCDAERKALGEIEGRIRGIFPLGGGLSAEDRAADDWAEQPADQAAEASIYRNLPPRRTGDRRQSETIERPAGPQPVEQSTDEQPTVEEALEELDRLIGLTSIKHEVRSLANFLKLQQRRSEAGLPETEISLHMVFTGNPGTGKTTVARIVGKIFGALGVLEKGHLVETDRSGLVAEYAGQTGPKTNAKIDEALGGLLFIDEAYSLVARGSEDPYGREAAQTLLKRAEDDRGQMVIILAGYPDEMQDLLLSNPGLSSRFSRKMDFADYSPLELAQIFGLMCGKNHYELTPAARLKVMLGLQHLYSTRNRHFGNGRESRNLFEHAVRRMANRLADEASISQEQLVTLRDADIEFVSLPAAVFEDLDESRLQVSMACGSCELTKAIPLSFLGKKVKCPQCGESFVAEWGELSSVDQAAT
ncbi:Stage V sporulation protein K [Posidoniimonas polymericola]|uniref:Stage V sporulation protein K n=1 Tax=Posidoniimonas polymericola TaxID=2528002 RepID=A0A5C5XXA9_9BACT|nr:AAA family ATPase [Posidoniimonas polymericola]TWT66993.1 Stage V sporulation protein K [Posidoniimonas polymericola]